MKKWILALCIFGSIPAFSQEVTKFSAGKHNDYGLLYSLPRTTLDLEVTATKTTYKVGPYYQYAEKYLGIPVTITENGESWVLDKVRVQAVGVPDKDQKYLVQFKNGSTPFMFLSKEGLLLSINTDPVIDTLKATQSVSKTPSPLDNNSYASVFTEELLMSGSTAKMAEIAAKQLYRIRESRLNLVTGDADQLPADGESFKLVMKQLEEQEQALVALFMGTTQTEKTVQHFTFIPEQDISNEVVFRFSNFAGIVDKNNLSGIPVYLTLNITDRGEMPIDNKGKVKEVPKGGVAYCIPGNANVELQFAGKSIFKNKFQVAQFGIVYSLSPGIFDDKKAPASVTFYPQTGAIRDIATQ